MTAAFERRGVTWREARTSREIESFAADFVIVCDPAQAKVWAASTFGWVDGPRLSFFRSPAHQTALISWDGLLGTSAALARFGDAFAAGWRRPFASAIFAPSPTEPVEVTPGLAICARLSPRADEWSRAVYGKLGLGRAGSEPSQSAESCKAVVDLPDFESLCEETISMAALDAAASGALLIAPDLSINRELFGDGFIPYAASPSADETARAIGQALTMVEGDPPAADRVLRTRMSYQRTASQDVMVERLLEAIDRFTASKRELSGALGDPRIDVIVRAGGRPLALVERALRSIDAQSAGRFRVVLVRYRNLDLAPLAETNWSRIDRIDIVDIPGGSRAQTLCAGLRAVRSPWFACLDDDDFWGPDHIEALLSAVRHLPEGRAFAYSGLVEADARAPEAVESRRVSMLHRGAGNLLDVMGVFGLHCFLAARPLLEGMNLDGWGLTTAEDTALIGQLLAKAEVAYSYRPTAFISVGGEDRSNFLKDPRRPENLVEAFLRIGPGMEVIEQKSPKPALRALDRITDALEEAARARAVELAAAAKGDVLVLGDGILSAPLHQRADVEAKPLLLSEMTLDLRGRSRFVRDSGRHRAELLADPDPWAEAAGLPLSRFDLYGAAQWIVVELGPISSPLGVGLLASNGRDFLRRMETPASESPVEVWLSIPDPAGVSRLVIQNWAEPARTAVELRTVHVVRRA